MREYQSAKGAHVKLGFQGAKGEKEHKGSFGSKVIDIAIIHEFGAHGAGKRHNVMIPERSFLRSTFDRTVNARNEIVKGLIGKILIGSMTVERALDQMGVRGVSDIKTTIQKSIGIKPLNPSTIKAKGSSVPLIDTGQLINSIQYQKVMQSKGGAVGRPHD